MKDMSTKTNLGMEYFKVVTSKGKVFENVKAEDILYSHKIGKIRGGSKIQNSEGKWFRVEDFIRDYTSIGKKDNDEDNEVKSKNKGIDFSGGNKKILDILAGKAIPGQSSVKKSVFHKYVSGEGRVFLLAFICFGSILLNVGLVFYYDLGKNKEKMIQADKKEYVFDKKDGKNKKNALAKAKVEKKNLEEMEYLTRKSEGYYRNLDQKSFEEEKGRILIKEKKRADK